MEFVTVTRPRRTTEGAVLRSSPTARMRLAVVLIRPLELLTVLVRYRVLVGLPAGPALCRTACSPEEKGMRLGVTSTRMTKRWSTV